MPTQEERIAAVETAIAASQQFQRDVTSRIREINENTTIALGLVQSLVRDISLIVGRLDQHTQILNEHSGILNQHTGLLNGHTERLDQHTQILNEHSGLLNEHTSLLKQILARLPDDPGQQ